MRVFVAGAAGAVGKPLVRRLISRGQDVVGTIRNPDKADDVRPAGATPIVLDGLDSAAVGQAVARAAPDVIVHEMTALSAKPDMRHFDRWFALTNRLRVEATQNLLAAARAVGVRRLVAQSYTAAEAHPVRPGARRRLSCSKIAGLSSGRG
jgi:nucleoside-diphosphate-sugar epimerase